MKTLRRVLGVEVDGVIGQNSLSAIGGLNRDISLDYIGAQEQFYYNIVNKDSSQSVFLRG